ncbi:hypothetical protein A4R44_06028 [Amycolatopsis sp. M39]|nr:hypothetical protein A4R44_06028 [Amycolatopsis sp. M39]
MCARLAGCVRATGARRARPFAATTSPDLEILGLEVERGLERGPGRTHRLARRDQLEADSPSATVTAFACGSYPAITHDPARPYARAPSLSSWSRLPRSRRTFSAAAPETVAPRGFPALPIEAPRKCIQGPDHVSTQLLTSLSGQRARRGRERMRKVSAQHIESAMHHSAPPDEAAMRRVAELTSQPLDRQHECLQSPRHCPRTSASLGADAGVSDAVQLASNCRASCVGEAASTVYTSITNPGLSGSGNDS